MPIDMPSYLETRRRFLANRAIFPVDELAKYAGQWVAWSPDGSRVAASAADPALLDQLLRAGGEDPLQCVIEGIPDDDAPSVEADGTGHSNTPGKRLLTVNSTSSLSP
jgi:hypothetical protein